VNRLTQLLEAALFSAAHPLSVDDLRRVTDDASREDVRQALSVLGAHYDQDGHAVELIEVAEGFQIVTRSAFAEAVAEAQIVRRPRKLSQASLETLAVVAYRQPVSRAEIEEIRGVSVESVLRSLLERGLLEVVGRGDGLGRPMLYGTTPLFLELLGLRSLDELPRLEELSVALRPPSARGEPTGP
jgi:segregation and condensation protein B